MKGTYALVPMVASQLTILRENLPLYVEQVQQYFGLKFFEQNTLSELLKNLFKNAALNEAGPDKNNPRKNSTWYYMLKAPAVIRGIVLEEDLKYGQKIASATISLSLNGEQVYQEAITTIGNKRIILLPNPVQATELSIVINEAKGLPILKRAKAF